MGADAARWEEVWPSDNHLPGARPKTGPPRPDRPLGCDKGIDSPPKIPPAFHFRPRRRVCADCLLCKSVANLSRGPDRGGRGRAGVARSGAEAPPPRRRGPARGPIGGDLPDIFGRHACGMPGGARARAGRRARARRPGGRARARRPGGRARAGVRAWAWGVPATAGVRAYVRAWTCAPATEPRRPILECAAEGRPTEPRSPSVAGPLPQNSGVTSKNVGRQRSTGRFRYISVGHSAHERKVGPCVAVLRGPSVDR